MADLSRPDDSFGYLVGYVLRRILIIGVPAFVGLATIFAIGAASYRLSHGAEDGGFFTLWGLAFSDSNSRVGGTVANYGFGVAILLAFAGAVYQVSTKHIAEYGPTVGSWTATALLLGLPALALLASWSGSAASTTIPRVASLGALFFTVVGMGLVAAASFIRRRPGDLADRVMAVRSMRWLRSALNAIVTISTMVVTFLDIGLVRVVAVISGATNSTAPKRYAGFLIPFAVATALVMLAPTGWWWQPAIWAALSVLSLWRCWSWVELDRQRFLEVRSEKANPHTGIRLGFREDFRDEALVAMALAILVLLPVTLRRVNFEYGLFTGTEGGTPTAVEWMTFIGGELAKAVPMIDWSEIYGIETALGVQPATVAGRHVVFSLRVMTDVLMIGAIIQTITTRIRLDEQRQRFANPNDPLDILDPFEERATFQRCAEDWTVVEGLRAYSPNRLETLLREGGRREILLAAARLSGWQLAAPVIRLLLESPPEASEFRNECASGLQRRADQIERSGRPDASVSGIIAALQAPVRAITVEINEALRRIDKRRTFDLQIVRIAHAATGLQPQSRQAFHELCADADRNALLALVHDPAPTTREAAYSVLAERSDVPAETLIEGLADKNLSVRKAVVLALYNHRETATVQPLIKALLLAKDDDLKKTIIVRLGQLGDPEAIAALGPIASARSPISRISGWPSFEGKAWREMSDQATWAIGQIGAEHGPAALDDVLATQHPVVVLRAANALAAGTAANGDMAARHLRRLLRETKSSPSMHRLAAVQRRLTETASGRRHDLLEQACVELIRAVHPPNEMVALGGEMLNHARPEHMRLGAVYQLANAAIPESRAPLEAAAASDPSELVQRAAMIALASHHRASMYAAPEALIQSSILDVNSPLRAFALQQLPCLPAARRELTDQFISQRGWQGNPLLFMSVLATMGRLGYRGAPDVVIEGLRSVESGVRGWAAFAGGLIGDEGVVTPLLQQLKDPDTRPLVQVIVALSRLHSDAAVDAIDAVLAKDPAVRVRRTGAVALWVLAPSHQRAATLDQIDAWLEQKMVSRHTCMWALADGKHRGDAVFWERFENDSELTLRMLAARAREVMKSGSNGD